MPMAVAAAPAPVQYFAFTTHGFPEHINVAGEFQLREGLKVPSVHSDDPPAPVVTEYPAAHTTVTLTALFPEHAVPALPPEKI